MNHACRINSQHGIALVLVLWALLLLTIVTGSFALMARMDRPNLSLPLKKTYLSGNTNPSISLITLFPKFLIL